MISFAVITAQRPRPTLADSIESLKGAGFADHPILISSDDPKLAEIDCALTLVNGTPLGNLRNWTQALTMLVRQVDAKWLCVCEDDITWVPGCRTYLEADLNALVASKRLQRTGALSLYFPIVMSNTIEKGGRLKSGWHAATRGIKTWGAQCFLFSRHMAIDLLSSRTFSDYLSNPKWEKNVDGIIADALDASGREILYRVPCLVDHTLGDGNSSLGYPADRPKLKTRYFTGAPT